MSEKDSGSAAEGVFWFLVAFTVVGLIAFGITCGAKSSDTKKVRRDPSTGCMLVTYKTKAVFGKDHDYTGTYCRADK